jgi:hypothetical protein
VSTADVETDVWAAGVVASRTVVTLAVVTEIVESASAETAPVAMPETLALPITAAVAVPSAVTTPDVVIEAVDAAMTESSWVTTLFAVTDA